MKKDITDFELRCRKCGTFIVAPEVQGSIIHCPVCHNEKDFAFPGKMSYVYWAEDHLCEFSGMILDKPITEDYSNLFDKMNGHKGEFIGLVGAVQTDWNVIYAPLAFEEIMKEILDRCNYDLNFLYDLPSSHLEDYLKMEIPSEKEGIEGVLEVYLGEDFDIEGLVFEDDELLNEESEFFDPVYENASLDLPQKVLYRFVNFLHVHPEIFKIMNENPDFYFETIPCYFTSDINFHLASKKINQLVKPKNIWYHLDKNNHILGKFNMSPLREDAERID